MGIQTHYVPVEYEEEDTGVLWEYTAVVEHEYIPPNPGTWDSDLDYYGVDEAQVVSIEDIYATQKVLTFYPNTGKDTGKFHYKDVTRKFRESGLDENIVNMLYSYSEHILDNGRE